MNPLFRKVFEAVVMGAAVPVIVDLGKKYGPGIVEGAPKVAKDAIDAAPKAAKNVADAIKNKFKPK